MLFQVITSKSRMSMRTTGLERMSQGVGFIGWFLCLLVWRSGRKIKAGVCGKGMAQSLRMAVQKGG